MFLLFFFFSFLVFIYFKTRTGQKAVLQQYFLVLMIISCSFFHIEGHCSVTFPSHSLWFLDDSVISLFTDINIVVFSFLWLHSQKKKVGDPHVPLLIHSLKTQPPQPEGKRKVTQHHYIKYQSR